VVINPNLQSTTTGVDYQAADLGGTGFALSASNVGLQGGAGGSGDFGVGGLGSIGLAGNGLSADGNGAGGGGAASNFPGGPFNGGDGSDGLWIIEEYS
jgi:hypothetical protein